MPDNSYFYNILPANNSINLVLTYKSSDLLRVGDLVQISIRNKLYYGLILSQTSLNSQKYEVKEISKVYPISFSKEQLQFLQLFSTNTFNSLNLAFGAMVRGIKLIDIKKFWEKEFVNPNLKNFEKKLVENKNLDNLQNPLKTEKNNSEKIENELSSSNTSEQRILTPLFDFYLENDITVRIIYLIRSIIQRFNEENDTLDKTLSRTVVITFPEQKALEKIYSKITENDEILNTAKNFLNLEFLKFNGLNNKENKKTLKSLLSASTFFANTENNHKEQNFSQKTLKIIFTLRSGIFLPFNIFDNVVTDLILVDESNSLYIQEQNSLYFDTRDCSYFFSKAFGTNLYFVSTLPSLRLYNFNPEVVSQKLKQSLEVKPLDLKIYLTQKNKNVDKYDLFSEQVENLLFDDDKLVGE